MLGHSPSFLVNENLTIVSGLAEGMDTIAHTTAIEQKGRTIAVIGTPICDAYPPSNAELQERIERVSSDQPGSDIQVLNARG